MDSTLIKRDRKAIGFKLLWGRKGSAEMVDAAQERGRPRVGRKARRTGMVDELA